MASPQILDEDVTSHDGAGIRSPFRPDNGRSLAFKRPWSASTRLFAYWVVSWRASGRGSVITRAKVGDRSVVTSVGAPWALMALTALEKNRVAVLVSRCLDTNTTMN